MSNLWLGLNWLVSEGSLMSLIIVMLYGQIVQLLSKTLSNSFIMELCILQLRVNQRSQCHLCLCHCKIVIHVSFILLFKHLKFSCNFLVFCPSYLIYANIVTNRTSENNYRVFLPYVRSKMLNL